VCVDCDHGENVRYSAVQQKEVRADAINSSEVR
jgi:hypothetical protein